MAVYQGARRRAQLPLGLDALAGARRPAPADDDQPRAAQGRRAAVKAGRGTGRAGRLTLNGRRPARLARERGRPSSVGIALAAIVLAFSGAFLSLSQSVRVAATGYDIVRLVSERDRLLAISQDLRADVERLGSEPAIRKQAFDAGLGQLGAPLVIPAR